jgi:hypothetical protein
MIRIVCPHCHAPLSSAELEQANIQGYACLVCPECSAVLLSEPIEAAEFHGLDEHFAERTVSHV